MSQNPPKYKAWLITDTHLGHNKLAREFKKRPEGFSELILDGIFRSVNPGDTLIHLGDFCIGRDAYWHEEFMRLVPDVHHILVLGNHDKKSKKWYFEHGWGEVVDEMTIPYGNGGKRVRLSHRPLPKIPDISYNIHGHTHGNHHRDNEFCEFYDKEYHVDYSLEQFGYDPVTIELLLDPLQ